MSKRDVVYFLKETLKKQSLEDYEMNGSDVARYLKSRYFQDANEELYQFKEPRHEEVHQRTRKYLTEFKEVPKESEKPIKPVSLLQKLMGSRGEKKKSKNRLLLMQNQNIAGNLLPLESASADIQHPDREASPIEEDNCPSNTNNRDVDPELMMKKKKTTAPPRGPWPIQSPSSEILQNRPLEQAVEFKEMPLKRLPMRVGNKTKLSKLGEATLKAIRERREKKDRAIVLARMETRQAQINELRARAEAALTRARTFAGVA